MSRTRLNDLKNDPFVSIVSTAFNEEKVIESFVESCFASLDKIGLKGELVLVDDGSTDKTPQILSELQKKHTNLILIEKENTGITKSLWRGIEFSRGDIVYFTPSDLEANPIEDIERMLEPILSNKTDFVIGRRSNIRGNIYKTILSKTFNFLASSMFKTYVHDCGWVKAFRREVFGFMPEPRFDWHRFMVFIAAKKGFRIKETCVEYYPRNTSQSSFGNVGWKRVPIAFTSLIYFKYFLK